MSTVDLSKPIRFKIDLTPARVVGYLKNKGIENRVVIAWTTNGIDSEGSCIKYIDRLSEDFENIPNIYYVNIYKGKINEFYCGKLHNSEKEALTWKTSQNEIYVKTVKIEV